MYQIQRWLRALPAYSILCEQIQVIRQIHVFAHMYQIQRRVRKKTEALCPRVQIIQDVILFTDHLSVIQAGAEISVASVGEDCDDVPLCAALYQLEGCGERCTRGGACEYALSAREQAGMLKCLVVIHLDHAVDDRRERII